LSCIKEQCHCAQTGTLLSTSTRSCTSRCKRTPRLKTCPQIIWKSSGVCLQAGMQGVIASYPTLDLSAKKWAPFPCWPCGSWKLLHKEYSEHVAKHTSRPLQLDPLVAREPNHCSCTQVLDPAPLGLLSPQIRSNSLLPNPPRAHS